MNPVQHLLVATDFEPPAERATTYAVTLAGMLGARITLLHAVAVGADESAPPSTHSFADAHRLLEHHVARASGAGVAVEGALVFGNVADQVLRAIEERQVGLVFVGTHGRLGLPRLLLGRTAEEIIRRSPVPVLTASAAVRAERETGAKVLSMLATR